MNIHSLATNILRLVLKSLVSSEYEKRAINVRLIATSANSTDFVSSTCTVCGKNIPKKSPWALSPKNSFKDEPKFHTEDPRQSIGVKIEQQDITMNITGLMIHIKTNNKCIGSFCYTFL